MSRPVHTSPHRSDSAGPVAAIPKPAMPAKPPAEARHLRRNMAANVAGELVYIITGFILPRLVYDRIGAQMLGIWDFAWSMNAHFALLQGGMMSAVNQQVAYLNGRADHAGLRALTSSCFALFSLCGLLAAGIVAATAALLPALLPDLAGPAVQDARWVVLLLGLCVALRMPFHVFNGLISGHQQYVALNFITSGCYLAVAAATVALVVTGHGLVAMAAVHLAGEVIEGLLKAAVARRINPHWRIAPRFVQRETLRFVLRFGGKTTFGTLAYVLLYQTNSLLVGRFLGVETLAVFARARSLINSIDKLLRKVTMVFIPPASAHFARGETDAIAALLLRAATASLTLAVPGVLILVTLGRPLLDVWMGTAFGSATVLATLALGHLASFPHRGTYYILLAMASHGRPALAAFASAILATLLAVLFLGPLQLGLLGAALAIAIPVTLCDGLIIPWLACRAIGLKVRTLLAQLSLKAGRLAAPYATVMLAARLLPLGDPRLTMLAGLGGAALVAAWLQRATLRRFAEQTRVRLTAANAVAATIPEAAHE